MKKFNVKKRLFIFIICIFLTGCWDVKDLKRLSFVSGLALDEREDKKIELIYQILLPQSSMDSNGTGVPQTIIVQSVGKNLLEAVSNVALKEDRIYSEHLKVFLIGENLAKHRNIKGLINHFIRDDEVRRSSYVILTKGKASMAIKMPVKKKIASEKIFDISQNEIYNGKILTPMRLGKASEYLQAKTSFLIQALRTNKGEIIYDGAGIIDAKKQRLKGFISPKDVQSIQWLKGETKGGVIPSEIDKKPLTYEILSLNSKVNPEIKDGRLSFNIFVKAKGKISEDWDPHENSFGKPYSHQVQEVIEKKMEKDMRHAMNTLQKKYKIDPIQLGSYVHNKYPNYWRTHKKNWDEIFSQTSINYFVQVKVTNFGTKGYQ
ncbi:Ger(x)C family spore germination protein [Priestia aryabhattai]|uniref:Ger(x)C family spore germination protein n=1 Tax=Priestia aryabhattai TaxID=412384 RepID=UPI00398317C7